jgi:DNA-binding GntR family transcriptional regulator
MAVPSAIPRRSLHDEIAARLRDMIIAGELRPGGKLNEAELALSFGVSRTPLREGLKQLAGEGLIEIIPNRGAFVATLSEAEVAEMFPVMGIYEGLAAELACRRMSKAEMARLEDMHARMVAHWKAGRWSEYSKLNRAIHEAIFAIAGNATLSQQYHQLMVRIHAIRFIAKKTPERWAEAVADHEAIMAAFRARDAAALFALMREHLAHKADVVTAALRG